MCIRIYRQILKSVLVNLYCIVSYCISFFNSDDKDSKQSNDDQAMPHLHQGMEHQTKSKVLAH